LGFLQKSVIIKHRFSNSTSFKPMFKFIKKIFSKENKENKEDQQEQNLDTSAEASPTVEITQTTQTTQTLDLETRPPLNHKSNPEASSELNANSKPPFQVDLQGQQAQNITTNQNTFDHISDENLIFEDVKPESLNLKTSDADFNIDAPSKSSAVNLKTSASDSTKQEESQPKQSWFARLKNGLQKTTQQFLGIFSFSKVDESVLENLEDALLLSDVGVKTTQKIMEKLRQTIKKEGLESSTEVKQALKNILLDILEPTQQLLNLEEKTTVMMMVGVNGAGKTTTIGKLCQYFQQHQQKVLLAAGDTFRAAAKEQLQAWGARNDVHVITGQSDPASLAFDAVTSGLAKNYDIVMIDTAGRLPTQIHLLNEIQKVKRSISKAAQSDAFPHHTLLVLDGTTGQNAVQQVQVFHEYLSLTGLIITKLDGSAKGGVLLAIADLFAMPIYFVGVGESLADLQSFDAKAFIDALLND
jgi:fused signal recognition particle receptor